MEKYLKARLVREGIDFRKIHDLAALLDQLVAVEPSWEELRAQLEVLTSYAVAFRYPGESATREMARTAIADAIQIVAAIKPSFSRRHK